jgi:hypothetical protein
MDGSIRDEDKRKAKHRPPYLDNYILDPTTGIYKPKSQKTNAGGENISTGASPDAPIHVDVRPDRWHIGISLLTLIVVAGYTYYAARQVDVTNRQADIMKIGQQRAWIKIETDTVTLDRPLTVGSVGKVGPYEKKFEVTPDRPPKPFPDELYPDAYPGIVLETGQFPIRLTNFGNFPARRSTILASIVSTSDWDISHDAGHRGPNWWIEFACERAKWRFQTNPIHFPFFPGTYERKIHASVGLPPETHVIDYYGIAVCLVYQEVYGDDTRQFHETDIHHVAVLYCGPWGSPGWESTDKRPVIYERTEWGELEYPPVMTFKACEADTD